MALVHGVHTSASPANWEFCSPHFPAPVKQPPEITNRLRHTHQWIPSGSNPISFTSPGLVWRTSTPPLQLGLFL